MTDFIKDVKEQLAFTKDDNASLRASNEILTRLHNMSTKVLPEENRSEIKSNLKKLKNILREFLKNLRKY